jgi:hypothetical protein
MHEGAAPGTVAAEGQATDAGVGAAVALGDAVAAAVAAGAAVLRVVYCSCQRTEEECEGGLMIECAEGKGGW